MDGDSALTPWLEALLEAIAREMPQSAEQAARELSGMRVNLAVDDERWGISTNSGSHLELQASHDEADCSATLPRSALIRLLAGESTLAEAIQGSLVQVRADVSAIQRARRAFWWLFEAAIRAPACHTLYRDFMERTHRSDEGGPHGE